MGSSQKRCIFSSEIGRIWAQGCRRIDVLGKNMSKNRSQTKLEQGIHWKLVSGQIRQNQGAVTLSTRLYQLLCVWLGTGWPEKIHTSKWLLCHSIKDKIHRLLGVARWRMTFLWVVYFPIKLWGFEHVLTVLFAKDIFSSSVFHEWLSQDWQKPHVICRVFCPTARESKLPFSSSRSSLGMAIMIQQHRFSKRTDVVKLSPRFN